MNEFDATVIVNSQTNEMIKEWKSYSYDDNSLQKYVNNNQMSAMCMKIIQTEIPNRDSFKLNSTDVIFENTLTIDLGNKVCIIERIKSTHTVSQSKLLDYRDNSLLSLSKLNSK